MLATAKTLTDVRYASELKKTLISLGTLDSNKCKYTAEDRVLRIMKRTITIKMGKKIAFLCFKVA